VEPPFSAHKQGEDQLPEHPTSRQIALLGRQIAEAEQRFEALEQELDLPTQAIELKNGPPHTFAASWSAT
jgi:hypothetical protein